MFDALSDYMRLARAGAVMLRNDVVIPDDYRSRLPWIARFAGGFLRMLPGGGGKGRPGQRFANALEKLGPAWIKLGQFMATRPDVIGVEAVFGAAGQRLHLAHHAGSSAEPYVDGALLAIRKVPTLTGLHRGLDAVMD